MIAFVTLQLPYRYCDGWVCGFSMAIAIVVLYCAFASLLYRDRDSKLLYSDYYIAISRTVSRVLYSDRNCSLAIIIIIVCMYVCKSLFKHGKSSVKLKLKTKTNYNCFT